MTISKAEARPKPKMMTLTQAAADKVKGIMAAADKSIIGVRIGVENGGCAGMAYTMDYTDTHDPNDEMVEDKGVKILIDAKAILFLLGTKMDYRVDKLSQGFVFDNPNQTSACGCGLSVSIAPADAASLGVLKQD